jgi:hypothetical protein
VQKSDNFPGAFVGSLAPPCHFQQLCEAIACELSSSGGGLPGRLRLARVGTLFCFGGSVHLRNSLLTGCGARSFAILAVALSLSAKMKEGPACHRARRLGRAGDASKVKNAFTGITPDDRCKLMDI